ncbi:MAG: hypothetical protein HC783_13295 [Rhodobacteraceae bacterium]|nr:hypothetical protein [Paracoccaceae bacterium]
MSGPVFDLMLGRLSAAERGRLARLLFAIEKTRGAKAKATAEGQSETAEYLALQELTDAEAQLFELVLEPELFAFLTAIHEALAQIEEGQPCA